MRNNARLALLASVAILFFVTGCSQSEPSNESAQNNSGAVAAQQDTTLHTERLPRIAGAEELYASAPSTIFTTTDSVMQTAVSSTKRSAPTRPGG